MYKFKLKQNFIIQIIHINHINYTQSRHGDSSTPTYVMFSDLLFND